jgi:hypothetical protein
MRLSVRVCYGEVHTLAPPAWYGVRALFSLPRSLAVSVRVLLAGEKKRLVWSL